MKDICININGAVKKVDSESGQSRIPTESSPLPSVRSGACKKNSLLLRARQHLILPITRHQGGPTAPPGAQTALKHSSRAKRSAYVMPISSNSLSGSRDTDVSRIVGTSRPSPLQFTHVMYLRPRHIIPAPLVSRGARASQGFMHAARA